MAQQQKIGKLGEDIAVSYLESLDYQIKERNWRFSKAEIDIIAIKDKVLVFVEVKAKSYTYYGAPEESISSYKENLIIDAAGQYMETINYEEEIRFDIVSIVFDKQLNHTLSHYKDAFYPSI